MILNFWIFASILGKDGQRKEACLLSSDAPNVHGAGAVENGAYETYMAGAECLFEGTSIVYISCIETDLRIWSFPPIDNRLLRL